MSIYNSNCQEQNNHLDIIHLTASSPWRNWRLNFKAVCYLDAYQSERLIIMPFNPVFSEHSVGICYINRFSLASKEDDF